MRDYCVYYWDGDTVVFDAHGDSVADLVPRRDALRADGRDAYIVFAEWAHEWAARHAAPVS